MLVPFKDFCGGAAPDVIKGVNSQQCINLYPALTTGGKSGVVLRKCAGQEAVQSDQGIVQCDNGIYTTSWGDMYYMYSTTLLKRNYKNGGSKAITFFSTSLDYDIRNSAFSDNGTVLFMVATYSLYNASYNYYFVVNKSTDVVTTFTDASLIGSTHVAYLDGYFIVNDINTNVFRVSPADWNGTDAWVALANETDDQSPDPIQGLIVVGRDLWVFGTTGFSIYYNAGTTPMPFARNQSVSNSIGLQAPFSLASINNRAFWLGAGRDGNKKIFMSEGFNAIPISTPELDLAIGGYASTQDSIGHTWQESGHQFYSITFKTANITWVYDVSIGLWHQRSSKLSAAVVNYGTGAIAGYHPILSNGTYGRWNMNGIAEFNGDIYIKSVFTGDVKKLKTDVYTDDALPIIWRRTAPFISASLKRMFINYLQIDMDTGTGLLPATVQGYDPIIFLRYSDDGGKTWSQPKQGNIGKIGVYTTRVKWNRLGSSKNRLFEISGSDPVSTTIYQAFLDMEVENG